MEEVERLKVSIAADLQDILSESSIVYYPNQETPARSTNKRSIHYVPLNDDDKDEFIDLITNELVLRGLSPTGEFEEVRERLLQEVIVEHKLRCHLEKLQHCNLLDACMIALLHKIPCILHCENRVGIKLLTMILLEGFSNAQQGLIFSHIRCVRDRINAFAECIQDIFNTQILGDDEGPAQWRVPMDDDGTNVGVICLDNSRIRKVINKFELLVNVSVCDATRIVKYNFCIPHYRDGMVILHQ